MEENETIDENNEKSGWKKLIGFFLIFGACFFIGNVVLIGLAVAGGLSITDGLDIFSAVGDPSMKPYIKTGIGLNHLIIFTGTALCFAYWLKRKNWKFYFDCEKIEWPLLTSFILLLFCAYPIIVASASLFEGVEWVSQIDESSIEALMKMLAMDNTLDLIVNLGIVALLPAVGEELLFRGIIQKELIKRVENHHLAIIIASIIFSGVHLQIQGFLPKFFIGLILGYAYYWTKSIWYPMVLHFINNAIPTVLLFFAGEEAEAMQEEAIQPEKLHFVIGVVFSCFLCSFIIYNIRKQIEAKREGNV